MQSEVERVGGNPLACRVIVADDGWFERGNSEAPWGLFGRSTYGLRIIITPVVQLNGILSDSIASEKLVHIPAVFFSGPASFVGEMVLDRGLFGAFVFCGRRKILHVLG